MEGSKLYVGNLNYSVTDDELKELFDEFGEVVSVKIIENRGFGFVEMGTPEEAENAKMSLDNKEFKNRKLKVNAARPQENRQSRGFRSRRRRH